MKPFKFFLHAGSKPGPSVRLQEVLDDILSYTTNTANFINDCEKIVIFTSDNSIKIPSSPKIENYRTSEDWGLDILDVFYDFCVQNPNYNVLFGHCKGIIKRDNNSIYERQDDWRKLMCYFNITKYIDCIKILETYETCGVNYLTGSKNHYSGGYFWANAEYIKSLQKPSEYICQNQKSRYDAEMWIGMNLKKPYSMHQSNVNHYEQRYPKEKYEDK